MMNLTRRFIRGNVADSATIYSRGVRIYEHGSFLLKEAVNVN